MTGDAPPPASPDDAETHDTTGDEPAQEQRARRTLDVASTVLLALATVATAWAGYQTARWHGKQAVAQAAATAARVDGARLAGAAGRASQIDTALFIQWVDARANGETALATFYRRRFSDRLEPAFNAWIAKRPFANPQAELSPFAEPEYVIPEQRQSEALEAKAKASADLARVYIQRADDYVLCVVLLASALFFAGISTHLPSPRSEAAILGLGWAMLIGTLIWMATFPATISI